MDVFGRGRPLMTRQKLVNEEQPNCEDGDEAQNTICGDDKEKSSLSREDSEESQCSVGHCSADEALSKVELLDQCLEPIFSTSYACTRQYRVKCSPSYMHCPHSTCLATSYSRLCAAFRERATLLFTRDYTVRLGQALGFVLDLQELVRAEDAVLRLNCGSPLQRLPSLDGETSKLQYLIAICEDLRRHTTHWEYIKYRLKSDKWLAPHRGEIIRQLRGLRRKLYFIREVSIYLVSKLIHIGLQVFAFTPYTEIPEETLWSLTRGTEEFALIVQHVKARSQTSSLTAMKWLSPQNSCRLTNSCMPLSRVKPITLAKFLNQIASSRSEIGAKFVYNLLANDASLADLLHINTPLNSWNLSQSALPKDPYSGPNLKNCKNGCSKNYKNSNITIGEEVLTEDKHWTSLEDRLAELNLFLPDMQSNIQTVQKFIDMESDFVSQILTSLATNTNYIQNNPPKYRERTLHREQASNVSQYFQLPRYSQECDQCNGGHKCTKSVRWMDSNDSTAISFLKDRYLNRVWHHLRVVLRLVFMQPSWNMVERIIPSDSSSIPSHEMSMVEGDENEVSQEQGACRSKLGDMRSSSEVSRSILTMALHSLTAEGWVSRGLKVALDSVCQYLEASTCQANLDQGLRDCVGYMYITDYHQQQNKVDDHTSLCHLETINCIDSSLSLQISETTKKFVKALCPTIRLSQAPSQFDANFCTQWLPPAVYTFVQGAKSYLNWLATKSSQLRSTWKMQQYLFLAYEDLRVMQSIVNHEVDILAGILAECQDHIGTAEEDEGWLVESLQRAHQAVVAVQEEAITRCHLMGIDFENECRSKCADHWIKMFPLNNCWTANTTGTNSRYPQNYVGFMISMVMQPVVEGAACLCPDDQVSILTTLINTVFETWMEFILEMKVKFSIEGTCQLSVDFNEIQAWLQTNQFALDPGALQSVLQLDIFHRVSAAIDILRYDLPALKSADYFDGTKGFSIERNMKHASHATEDTNLVPISISNGITYCQPLHTTTCQKDSEIFQPHANFETKQPMMIVSAINTQSGQNLNGSPNHRPSSTCRTGGTNHSKRILKHQESLREYLLISNEEEWQSLRTTQGE